MTQRNEKFGTLLWWQVYNRCLWEVNWLLVGVQGLWSTQSSSPSPKDICAVIFELSLRKEITTLLGKVTEQEMVGFMPLWRTIPNYPSVSQWTLLFQELGVLEKKKYRFRTVYMLKQFPYFWNSLLKEKSVVIKWWSIRLICLV